MLALAPLLVLIGWSRVRLRCHTLGQVAVGMLIGAAVSAPLYTLLG
ncbi:phosphatase PAP2 family protein [Streptomyces sp. NPDC057456]